MARSIASALSGYLAACPPFDWATHNCTHFAAGWLQLVEGAAPPLPAVADGPTAHRAVRRLGADLADATTRQLGRALQPAAQARPGDLVLVPAPHGSHALAICAGRTAAVLTTAGVAHIPMQQALAAWHIKAAPCATP